jgi:flavin-binding protein dodecin
VLRGELDAALADALRRASNRAEHIRLTRIQSLVVALRGD